MTEEDIQFLEDQLEHYRKLYELQHPGADFDLMLRSLDSTTPEGKDNPWAWPKTEERERRNWPG